MKLSLSSQGQIARSFAVILLLVLLTACGSTNNGPHPGSVTPTSNPTSITTPTSNPITAPSLNSSGAVTINMAGLSIYSPDGIQCPLGQKQVSPSDYLVLTTDRLSYDVGELQDMKTYVANAVASNQSYLMSPPNALQWVPGGNFCDVDLQITNTGNSAIQISKAGVQLQQDAQPNSYQYRLIEACSVLQQPNCHNVPYIVPHCRAKVTLTSGSSGTPLDNTFTISFPGPDTGQDQQCPVLTLDPNKMVVISIDLSSPSNAGIFSVVPELTLSTQTTPLQLNQLATTIALNDTSQFTCYGLQGDTFTQVDQNTQGAWCV